MKYYIAYGSNLNIKQMKRRCPESQMYKAGELKDFRLEFRGEKDCAFLTVEPHEGNSVPVVVWKIGNRDEKFLDRYEGWPNFYRKENMTVELDDGEKLEGMAYVMNSQQLGMPRELYVETVIEGYENAKFNPQKFYEAYNLSAEKLGVQPYVGSVCFATGEIIGYKDAEEYLKTVKEELDYRSTSGFQFQTYSNEPYVRKAVDDAVYNLYGEKNPNGEEKYENTDFDMNMG